jgi:hypothetical protein
MKPCSFPLVQTYLHLFTCFRPFRADFRQSQITFGEFRAAAVHSIENIHNHVNRLVFAGDFFDVQINFLDRINSIQPIDVRGKTALQSRNVNYSLDRLARTDFHKFGDIDPEWVILHFQRGVEFETLIVQIEI